MYVSVLAKAADDYLRAKDARDSAETDPNVSLQAFMVLLLKEREARIYAERVRATVTPRSN